MCGASYKPSPALQAEQDRASNANIGTTGPNIGVSRGDPFKAVPSDREGTKARKAEEQRARTRGGRQSTVLTSPFGLAGEGTIRRKTLLGE